MKKALLSVAVIAVFAVYTLIHNNSDPAVPVATNKNILGDRISTGQGAYKDGTYTGNPTDAFYGTIQVKATIQNSKLVDVQFLQFPNDRDESVQINQQAMPALKQKAIQAQKAQVDIVSGATQTSQAFTQSLASALSQAK